MAVIGLAHDRTAHSSYGLPKAARALPTTKRTPWACHVQWFETKTFLTSAADRLATTRGCKIVRVAGYPWLLALLPRCFQTMPAPASQSGGVSGFWQPFCSFWQHQTFFSGDHARHLEDITMTTMTDVPPLWLAPVRGQGQLPRAALPQQEAQPLPAWQLALLPSVAAVEQS